MKTTFDIPEELLVEAKRLAAELRRPLRALVTEGLHAQLASGCGRPAATGRRRGRPRIRWVTVKGALAPGLADRVRRDVACGVEVQPRSFAHEIHYE